MASSPTAPIGVFDSGFGGLTVLAELTRTLPQCDFLYYGDNARAPYGSRSFETIYRYTLDAVKLLFAQGCPLVILACNTASARALRTIQQHDLPALAPQNRILGIIRPLAEEIGKWTTTGHIGVLGTRGTVKSESYVLEIEKFFPTVSVMQVCAPIWVPLVENGLAAHPATQVFVQEVFDELFQKDERIDCVALACTHYPLLLPAIQKAGRSVRIVSQGEIVAQKTKDYLERHPEMAARISQNGQIRFMTSDTPEFFEEGASLFWKPPIIFSQSAP